MFSQCDVQMFRCSVNVMFRCFNVQSMWCSDVSMFSQCDVQMFQCFTFRAPEDREETESVMPVSCHNHHYILA